jgi:hypothetical protein
MSETEISALQLSAGEAEILYCASMLGMVYALQQRIEPTPKVRESVEAWADLLRSRGEEKVVATVEALYATLGGQ